MIDSFSYAEGAPDDILSFTTTRYGGYSTGQFASLNFGHFTDDDIPSVLKNYKYIEQAQSISNLVVLKQVHGNIVVEVTRDNIPDVYLSPGDGLFTSDTDIALGVLTADCYALHLVGKKSISALHCGWRSLNSGIIENSLELFKKSGDFPIYAYIGPGICANCYEVRQDMVDKLNPLYHPEEALVKTGDEIYKLDLAKVLINALRVNGIMNYFVARDPSCCSDLYFSHRRDKGVTGRMISVLMRRGIN